MKKVLMLILILLIPTFVNAETLKVKDNSYSIEELENQCAKANLVLDGFDEKGAVCLDPADNFTKIYRVDNSGVKTELTNQEYLDYYNRFDYTHYTIYDSEDIYKVSGNDRPGYIEVLYENIDTNKIYVIITDEGNGAFSYTYTDDPNFVFDPALKYYEEINLALPKSADVKTDGSITYYTCDTYTQICDEVGAPKSEDVLNYYVENDNPYKEEKVAKIDSELFEMITTPKEGLEAQNYNIFKLPSKDTYYILYEEQTATTSKVQVYTHDGKLVFEDIDTFGVINDDLIYTIKDDNIVIYNTYKEVLKTISGAFFYKLYDADNKTIFSVDDNLTKIYEVKKLEEKKEETPVEENNQVKEETENKPIIDIKNPDTGDTVISAIVLSLVAVVGIIAVSKHKRKEN